MQCLISVIVPIYNVEKYLNKCVDSIISQTYKNLEIILVDDGSSDNCPKICDKYADSDSRIKVVHKKNGGLSDARNAGLKIATGEYIFFIDSDDWIKPQTLLCMMETAQKYSADIVECNVMYYYDNKNEEKYNDDQFAVYDNNASIMSAYIKDYNIKTVVWNKLYKRTIINDTCFEFGKYHEDEFFTYQILAKTNKLVHLDEYFYCYYQREGSIMGSSFSLKHLDSLEAALRRSEFIKTNYPNLYFYQLNYATLLCINHYQNLLKNKNIDKDGMAKRTVRKYRKILKWTSADKKRVDSKFRMYVNLSKISLGLCARLRNILKIGG